MDPVTLITTAVLAGSAIVGKKVMEKGTDELWTRFMALLRGKATGDEQASTALANVDDPQAVQHAVRSTNAAADPEIVQMANQVTAALPPQQMVQIAKTIQNFQQVNTLNQRFD